MPGEGKNKHSKRNYCYPLPGQGKVSLKGVWRCLLLVKHSESCTPASSTVEHWSLWLQPLTHPAQSDLDPKQKPLKEMMSCLKFCWLRSAVSFSLSKINSSLLEQNQSNKNLCRVIKNTVLGRGEDRGFL